MGHCIRAFIGKSDIINNISNKQQSEKIINLDQNISMLFLTDEFHDNILILLNTKETESYKNYFNDFTFPIQNLIEQYSAECMLAYIETDYFGGSGYQSAILYEYGKIIIGPLKSNDFNNLKPDSIRAINLILKKIGVVCIKNNDEFDSIGLSKYRNMY